MIITESQDVTVIESRDVTVIRMMQCSDTIKIWGNPGKYKKNAVLKK
jgi:hypothetical protein